MALVEIEGLTVDDETGEVMEQTGRAIRDPDEKLRLLAHRLKLAQEQVKSWEQIVTVYKLAIQRQMDEQLRDQVLTESGKLGIRRRHDVWGDPTLLDDAAREHELSTQDKLAILSTAKRLDGKALRELAKAAPQLAPAIGAILQERVSAYVQLDPVRKAAPPTRAIASATDVAAG